MSSINAMFKDKSSAAVLIALLAFIFLLIVRNLILKHKFKNSRENENKLLNLLGDKVSRLRVLEQENTTVKTENETFKKDLSYESKRKAELKREAVSYRRTIDKLKEELAEAKKNVPDTSTEELIKNIESLKNRLEEKDNTIKKLSAQIKEKELDIKDLRTIIRNSKKDSFSAKPKAANEKKPSDEANIHVNSENKTSVKYSPVLDENNTAIESWDDYVDKVLNPSGEK